MHQWAISDIEEKEGERERFLPLYVEMKMLRNYNKVTGILFTYKEVSMISLYRFFFDKFLLMISLNKFLTDI